MSSINYYEQANSENKVTQPVGTLCDLLLCKKGNSAKENEQTILSK